MSILKSIIEPMPMLIKEPLIKALYLKNGHKLKSIKSYRDKFFLYEVDGQFVPSESIGWFVSFDYYVKWVDSISALAYKPKNGAVVLDIGAGIGEESLVFSKMVGNSGRVFSIEANPLVYNVLNDVIKFNKLENVKLFNEAINIENVQVGLNVGSDSFLGGGIGTGNEAGTLFEIPGIRMDAFIERESLKCIDLMKVNIEGAERFVIESIGESIKSIKNVAISCHDFRYRADGNEFFRTRELVETYLKDNNFEIFPDNGGRRFEDWVYAANKAYSIGQ